LQTLLVPVPGTESRGADGVSALWRRLALAAVALALIVQGCSSREALNPVFQPEPEEYQRAIERGQYIIKCGDSPYTAYRGAVDLVNVRAAPDVIIREAACCWPTDEIAFAVAAQGDASDAAADRAARQALRRAERELKFVVVIQLPKNRDPEDSGITFTMRSSLGQSYPPIAVETPVYVRDVATALDPSMPPAALYSYTIRFPIRGSPGYRPITPDVTSLDLIVQSGESDPARLAFPIPSPPRRR
jgi:hypothetical protein